MAGVVRILMSQSNHSGMEIASASPIDCCKKLRLNRTIVEWKWDCWLTLWVPRHTKSQSNHSGMEMGAGNGSPKPQAGSLGLVER